MPKLRTVVVVMARRVRTLSGPCGMVNGLTLLVTTVLRSVALAITRRWASGQNNVREMLLIRRLVWFICRNLEEIDNGALIRTIKLIEFTLTLSLKSEAVIM